MIIISFFFFFLFFFQYGIHFGMLNFFFFFLFFFQYGIHFGMLNFFFFFLFFFQYGIHFVMLHFFFLKFKFFIIVCDVSAHVYAVSVFVSSDLIDRLLFFLCHFRSDGNAVIIFCHRFAFFFFDHFIRPLFFII